MLYITNISYQKFLLIFGLIKDFPMNNIFLLYVCIKYYIYIYINILHASSMYE